MKKKLFLEGDIGIGKSTIIREALLPFLPGVGGFFVQRIFIGDSYAAFQFHEVGTAAAYQLNRYVSSLDGMDNLFIFSDARGRWHKDLRVFTNEGSACLKKSMAAGKRLILLDEMGGIELACPVFMQAAGEVLDGDIPVLGVLKSRRNIQKLTDGLAGADRRGENNAALLSRIKDHPRVELLPVTEATYPEIRARVKAFVEGAFA